MWKCLGWKVSLPILFCTDGESYSPSRRTLLETPDCRRASAAEVGGPISQFQDEQVQHPDEDQGGEVSQDEPPGQLVGPGPGHLQSEENEEGEEKGHGKKGGELQGPVRVTNVIH